MRIALVCQPLDSIFPPVQTSLGIWAREFADELAKSDDVFVYARKTGHYDQEWSGPSAPHYRLIRSLHYRIWRLALAPLGWLGRMPVFARTFFCFDYALQVALDVRRQRCDVVHVMNFSQLVPLLRRFNPHIRVVLHMQCEWLNQLPKKPLEKRLANVDLVLGCSDFITHRAERRFPIAGPAYATLFNGVNTRKFAFKEGRPERKNDGPVILYVGRFSPEKGMHVLLQAFAKVLESFETARLVIAAYLRPAPKDFIITEASNEKIRALRPYFEGDYYEKQMQSLAPTVTSRIKVLGPVPHHELPALFSKADLFVFPSVWDEPAGIPQIEAMAAGTPVVATTVGGIPEYVLDKETGLLVEPGDADALAEAIETLLKNDGLRSALIERALRRVEQTFTITVLADHLRGAYRNLVEPD